jgi:hemoglobin-like flavoprotein
MDEHQILLVKYSFAQLAPNAAPLADLLYARLFQLDPTVRNLFPNDLHDYKDKFLHMLTFVVEHLEQPEEWLPGIEQLGKRHLGYGIQTQHYETFGSALIWTLDKAIGEDFVFEVLGAWVAFYTLLANTMQAAANSLDPAIERTESHSSSLRIAME